MVLAPWAVTELGAGPPMADTMGDLSPGCCGQPCCSDRGQAVVAAGIPQLVTQTDVPQTEQASG